MNDTKAEMLTDLPEKQLPGGEKAEKKQKNYGIELLRILSMYMIVILHVIGQGGISSAVPVGSHKYIVSWLMLVLSYCAVNCYAIISGYVSCRSRFRFSKILSLWLLAVFFNTAIWCAARVFFPYMTENISFVSNFMPISGNQYWYFTAYVGVLVFLPGLNALVNNLSKKQMRWMLLGALAIIALLPEIRENDIFYTHQGYSFLWLAIMYIVGAYFRLHFTKKKWLSKPLCLLYYFASALLLAALKFTKEYGMAKNGVENPVYMNHVSYTSIFVIICAVSLFLFFVQIDINRTAAQKIISFFSKSTFGVYIIHTNLIIWLFVLQNRFANFIGVPLPLFPLCILAAAAVIFLSCTLLEKIRELLFKYLFVDKLCSMLDAALDKLYNRFL